MRSHATAGGARTLLFMELHRYRFRSVWDFARPPDEVFAVLRVVGD
ncbi:hypothetical protein HEP87_62015 [Streptomyces sp. S1D4-11]